MNKKFDYDIVIIGGGAGGLFAASVANALKAKACIVEKKRLGGDCTWHGCMPSKAILKSATVAHLFKKAADYGLRLEGQYSLQTTKALSYVRDVVGEIATHHEPGDLIKRGIDVIIGPPCFVHPNTIEVNGKRISAKRFILCTGSHPVVPPIEGLSKMSCLTNENIFDLEAFPKSLIVLGGGPIGAELSQALSRLGVKITLVEMLDRILFREEPEIAKFVEDQFREENIEILTGRKAVEFSQNNGQVTVMVEDKQKNRLRLSCENILVAVGRAPNVEGLNLEKAGIEYSNRGIKVNDYLQTTNPSIFACGDIASPYQFSHVAAYQAGVCVRNALFRRLAWQRVNYSNMAWATFTDPELARLGLTEDEARQQFKDIKVYKTPYGNSDRSVTDREQEGLLKIITDTKDLILGAHIVGTHAGEIIQGLLIAKSQKIPLSKIAQTLFIYPTLSELVKKTAAKPFVEKGNHPLMKWLMKALKCV